MKILLFSSRKVTANSRQNAFCNVKNAPPESLLQEKLTWSNTPCAVLLTPFDNRRGFSVGVQAVDGAARQYSPCREYLTFAARALSDGIVTFAPCSRIINQNTTAMKQYDTYIFDLDGTLLNTLGDLTASTNHAMRAFSMPEHTVDDVRRFVGNGIKKLIERAVPDGTGNPRFDDVYAVFMEHYLKHSLDTTRPYDGVMPMLASLKRDGRRMAVVSNKYCTATEALCRHFFSDYINVAIGESEIIRKKPAPDSVREAMRRLGADPATTVYVGDSEVDVATARNSGLPCISVLWGFRDRDFLIANGADTFVSNPVEIAS